MQLLSENYASKKLLLNDPNDVRGHTSLVWVHSANQIILFHFALTIYDEFDANAMVAINAVSMSMYSFWQLCHIIIVINYIGTIETDDSVRNPGAITAN